MSILEPLRRQTRMLHLALLLGCLTLASLAYAGHHWEPLAAGAAHGDICGYCAAFDAVADAPPRLSFSPTPVPAADPVPIPVLRPLPQRLTSSTRQRAPPAR